MTDQTKQASKNILNQINNSPTIQATKVLGSVVGETFKDILDLDNGPSYGTWARHAIIDTRYKEELKKASAYTFAGGYDITRRYPEFGEGLKLLAQGYQGMSTAKRIIDPTEKASSKKIIDKEMSDAKGNIAGIEQAMKDIEAHKEYMTKTVMDELDKRVIEMSKQYSKTVEDTRKAEELSKAMSGLTEALNKPSKEITFIRDKDGKITGAK